MSKIPEFNKFNEAIVAAGFGQMNINNFALGGALQNKAKVFALE